MLIVAIERCDVCREEFEFGDGCLGRIDSEGQTSPLGGGMVELHVAVSNSNFS